jgi:hypothetical protein
MFQLASAMKRSASRFRPGNSMRSVFRANCVGVGISPQ